MIHLRPTMTQKPTVHFGGKTPSDPPVRRDKLDTMLSVHLLSLLRDQLPAEGTQTGIPKADLETPVTVFVQTKAPLSLKEAQKMRTFGLDVIEKDHETGIESVSPQTHLTGKLTSTKHLGALTQLDSLVRLSAGDTPLAPVVF